MTTAPAAAEIVLDHVTKRYGESARLSWPLIFAGIRTASVYVIATAPLGLVQRAATPAGLVVSRELHTIVPPAESDLPADRAVSVNP